MNPFTLSPYASTDLFRYQSAYYHCTHSNAHDSDAHADTDQSTDLRAYNDTEQSAEYEAFHSAESPAFKNTKHNAKYNAKCGPCPAHGAANTEANC